MSDSPLGYLYVQHVPQELKEFDQFVLWKLVSDNKKTPCCKKGNTISYANQEAWLPFDKASAIASAKDGLGLGFSLGKEGTRLNRDEVIWNLCVLDFDGFVNDVNAFEVDEKVDDFLLDLNTYAEVSPSCTGLKCFFWTDKNPTGKFKIKFGPSKFAELHPEVRKYSHREVEVFSKGYFMTVTGDILDDREKLAFISADQFDKLIDKIDSWGRSTGGTGNDKACPIPDSETLSTMGAGRVQGIYSRLEPNSLKTVLAHINHHDESTWSDTANAIARVYGEFGRDYFVRYSRGDYAKNPYISFDPIEVEERYERALEDVEKRPHGYGVKHLIEIAQAHSEWASPVLNYIESEGKIDQSLSSADENKISPLEKLKSFSVTGKSEEFRASLLTDAFVLKDIAILGQWTTVYGQFGSGKTLLVLWLLKESIQAKNIAANGVYYVNADDTYKGALDKLELAEGFGMQVVLPNQNGFVEKDLMTLMSELANNNQAEGVVLVLDTLKKFTNLMDKSKSSEFGNVARSFVQAKGTLICLAHTNKYKDGEGRSIYEGTGDIINDADCVYTLEKISEDSGLASTRHTVEFHNSKARGDVAPKVLFEYEKIPGFGYSALFNSVKKISDDDAALAKKKALVSEMLNSYDEIIIAITESIDTGIITKENIVKTVRARTGESTRQVKTVLQRCCGVEREEGHLWNMRIGPNNRNEYHLLPPSVIKTVDLKNLMFS